MPKRDISTLMRLKGDASNLFSWMAHILERRGQYDLAGEELKSNCYYKFDFWVRKDTVKREFIVRNTGETVIQICEWDADATSELRDHNNLEKGYQDKYIRDRKRLCMDLLSLLSPGYKEKLKKDDVTRFRFELADSSHDSLEMFRMIKIVGEKKLMKKLAKSTM